MYKHERSTYKAGRTTAIANQLNRKQQKKEDQSKASFMDAKQVKRKAFPREYPELCIEWLSRPPGVAGSNMFCLPLSTGLLQKSAAGAETCELVSCLSY